MGLTSQVMKQTSTTSTTTRAATLLTTLLAATCTATEPPMLQKVNRGEKVQGRITRIISIYCS